MRRKNITLFIGIGLVMLYCFFIHIDAKAGNESEKVLSIGRYEYDYDKYEVMDGLQRLTAIMDFYNNEYKLSGLEEWKELEGKKYKDLP